MGMGMEGIFRQNRRGLGNRASALTERARMLNSKPLSWSYSSTRPKSLCTATALSLALALNFISWLAYLAMEELHANTKYAPEGDLPPSFSGSKTALYH